MTKNDVIEQIAKEKMVEKIINNISKGSFKNTDDLAQDLYINLLEKPEEKIVELYEKKQLNFFITRMVRNNLLSKNSPYYYEYQLWNKNRTEFKYTDDNEKNNTEIENIDYTDD